MNKSYRSIWNEALGAWVAASETTRARGKRGSVVRAAVTAGVMGAVLLGGAGNANAQATITDYTGHASPDPVPGAVLDINSYTRGVMMPRVALTDAITWGLPGGVPADGMMLFNTTPGTATNGLTQGLVTWKGGRWVSVDETPYLHVNSTAVGNSTQANSGAIGANSVAIGPDAKALANDTVAMGNGAEAHKLGDIAIGRAAIASGGDRLTGPTENWSSVAVGTYASATEGNSVALGGSAKAEGRGTALGSRAEAGYDTVAIGTFAGMGRPAKADPNDFSNALNTFVGSGSGVAGNGARNSYVGNQAGVSVQGDENAGMGYGAGGLSTGSRNVAVGQRAGQFVTGDQNINQGTMAGLQSKGSNNIALGTLASANLALAAQDPNAPISQAAVQAANLAAQTEYMGFLAKHGVTEAGLADGTYTLDASGNVIEASSGNVLVTAAELQTSVTQAFQRNGVAGIDASRTTAIGHLSRATGDDAVALGSSAVAGDKAAVAIGTASKAFGVSSVAVGDSAFAKGEASIAMGKGAQANGTQSISIGTGNAVNGNNSGAIGDPTVIDGANSYSVGNNNTLGAAANNTFVLGNNVNVNVANATALGDSTSVTVADGAALGSKSVASTDKGVAGFDPAAGKASTDTSATWKSTLGAVSVGGNGQTRQITNVAAGTQATDAVNVAQLKAGQTHYYSVNDNGVPGGNYANDGATGTNAMAAGVNAAANGANTVAVGVGAQANGLNSLSVGPNAGQGSSGAFNAAFGSQAGRNVTGTSNVALGGNAGNRVTGDFNLGVGEGAGGDVQGAYNTAQGYYAGVGVEGQMNLASGLFAGAFTKGDSNVALGSVAGLGVEANDTVSIGSAAVAGAERGIAIGKEALAGAQGKFDSIAIGTSAVSGNDGIAIGGGATASNDRAIAIGMNAGQGAGAGVNQLFIGLNAGANSSGDEIVAIGQGAATDAVGSQNVSVGSQAGTRMKGKDNVNVGINAGVGLTGDENVNTGVLSGYGATGSGNAYVGWEAGRSAKGDDNAAVGRQAGYGVRGDANAASGYGAMYAVQGNQNAASGAIAGAYSVGNNNVASGSAAGVAIAGNNNVTIGQSAGTGYVVDTTARTFTDRNGNAVTATPSTLALNDVVAIGNRAITDADRTIAVGKGSTASAVDAIAIGSGAKAVGAQSISIGTGNVVNGNNSGAIGDPSVIDGANSYSVGNNNTLGAAASNTFVLGNNVNVNVANATALGDSTSVTVADGVALGSKSVASTDKGVAGFDPATGLASTDTSATWKSTLGAVSVGGNGQTRQITNVAAGTQATDAVNVAQLKAGQTHYYSVNDNGVQGGNYANDGATGINALAAGVGAQANGERSVSIGYLAGVGASAGLAGQNNVGIGTEAGGGVVGSSNTAVGSAAGKDVAGSSNAAFGIAAGQSVQGDYNLAMGAYSGMGTKGTYNTAVGGSAGQSVTGNDNIAMGDLSGASVVGDANIGIGALAGAGTTGSSNIAIGSLAGIVDTATFAGITANNTVSIGNSAVASKDDGVAVGHGAQAAAVNSVALGADSKATQDAAALALKNAYVPAGATAVAGTAPVGEVSVGSAGKERRITNVAAGSDDTDAVNVSQLKGAQTHYYSVNDNGTQGGNYDNKGATGINAIAAGVDAVAAGVGTVAVGNMAGSGSTAAGNSHNTFVGYAAGRQVAGADNTAVGNSAGVSVTGGNNTALGLSAGARVTGDSNIGIGVNGGAVTTGFSNVGIGSSAGQGTNGAFNVALGGLSGGGVQGSANVAIGLNAGENISASNTVAIGNRAKATGDSGVSIGTDASATYANAVALGANSTTATDLATLNANAAYVPTGATSVAGATPVGEVSIGGVGAERRITNVAAGAIDTDAVNVSQLKAVDATANAGWNVAANGEATGGNVAPGAKVDFSNSDGNIAITRTGTDLDFKLADDVKVNNSVTVGQSVLNTTGLTVNDGTTTTAVAAGGVTSGTVKLSGVTNDIQGLSNKTLTDPSFATVGRAATEEQLKIVNDTASAGWNVAANGEATGGNVAPGGKVDFSNSDSNVTITRSGTNLDFKLADDVKVNNSVNVGQSVLNTTGLTVNNGTTTTAVAAGGVTSGTVNLSGVTNDIQGLSNKTLTDPSFATVGRGATEEQLKIVNDTASAGWNVAANGEATGGNVAPGGKVDFSNSDSNIAITRTGTNLDFKLADDVKVNNSVTVGQSVLNTTGLTVNNGTTTTAVAAGGVTSGTVNLSGVSNDIQGLSNKTLTDPSFATVGRAATEEQLKIVNDTASAGWNVAANGEATGGNVAPGGKVDFSNSDSNIAITRTGTNLDFKLADDVKVNNSVTVGQSVLNTTGLTVNNGTTTTVVAAGGVTSGSVNLSGVTNDIQGLSNTTLTDPSFATVGRAATEEQLKKVNDTAGAGWNVAANGEATGGNVAPGGKVDFSNSDSNIAITRSGTNLDFKLADDVKVNNSVTVGQSVLNTTGLTVNNGTTTTAVAAGGVTSGSVNLSGVTNDIKGLSNTTLTDPSFATAGRAATEEQLKKVNDTASAGWNVAANGEATGGNVAPGGKVDFSNSDSNVTITRSGTNLDFKLADDVKVNNSVTVGQSVLNTTGLTVNDGTTTTAVAAGGVTSGTAKLSGVSNDIQGLSNKTLTDPSFATVGRGATEEQLKIVNDTASAGWNVAANGEATGGNVAPGGKVDFSNSDSNIAITRTGTNLDFKLANDVKVNNSVTVGQSVLNTTGLTVNDGTTTTAVAAGGVTSGTVKLSGVSNDIQGLSNKTLTDPSFATVGRAATEEQLKQVNDTASAGWNVAANGEATGGNVAPGGKVDFSNSDSNVTITRNGTNLDFKLADDVKVNNSVTVGQSVLNTTGLTVNNGTTTTAVAAGGVTSGTVKLSGVSNDIQGLSNKTLTDPSFATVGRAATEEQLKLVDATASKGWNLSANGEATPQNIAPGGTANFANGDNMVVTRNGNTLTVATAKDVKFDSVTTGDTVMNNAGVTVGPNVTLGATGLTIVGGPSVTTAGVDAGGKVITNVAPGVAGTDAVNVSQLKDTVAESKTKYYSVNSTGGGNENNDGATGADAIAAGKDAQATAVNAVAMGTAAQAAGVSATSIGNAAWAMGDRSTAVGYFSTADGIDSAAFGAWARAAGNGSVAAGAASNASGVASVAMGAASAAVGDVSVAVGAGSTATATGGAALGAGSVADRAAGVKGYVPPEATTAQADAIAATTSTVGAVGVGDAAHGVFRQITGVAAGSAPSDAVNVAQLQAVASQAAAAGSKWITGSPTTYVAPTSTGTDSTAVGSGAAVKADQGVAIGTGAVVTTKNSVALGNDATTAEAKPTKEVTLQGTTYQFAGTKPVGVVSVGSKDAERQLTNVAAGEISATSTDAVNGSQLYATNQAINNMTTGGGGIKYFHANSKAADSNAAGAESVAIGPNAVALGNNAIATGNNAQAKAAGSIALGANSTASTANSVALGDGAVANRAGMNGQREMFSNTVVQSAQGAVSVGSAGNERQITNVAGGTQATDAVNVRQLQAVQQSAVRYDTNVDGSVNYNSVTMGNGASTGPVTVQNVAPGVAPTDAVNVQQLNQAGAAGMAYTDARTNALGNELRNTAKNAYAGVAAAMAVQMPGTSVPGKTVMRVGYGTFKGESAVGISFRRTAENNGWSVTGGVGMSRAGAAATVGAEWVFN
ncbi:hypothetical protein GmRootV118_27310 [Variovorax sp. V118]|uniref:ESPR-type extended signal peptide-containing protein n=1 Tax=Variovorax sp. V118 TaxID=3065954 RepID=UPI0034E89034